MCTKNLLCTFLLVFIITFKVYGVKNMIQDCLKCGSGISDKTDIQRLKVPSPPTKVTNIVKSLRRGRFIFGDVIDDVINCFIKENKKEDTILYVSSYIFICVREKNFSPLIEYMTNLITQEKTIILVNIHVGLSAFSYHWVLGVINLVSKQIIILDSEKIIRINLYEILYFIMSSYFNIRTFYDNSIPKPIASEWQFILAKNAIRQYNCTDCGIYVCIHAYHYITNENFFRLNSYDGRQWLYYYYNLYNENKTSNLNEGSSSNQNSLSEEDINNIIEITKQETRKVEYNQVQCIDVE